MRQLPIPTIALAAHWHSYPDRFTWLVAHGFAVEYSPNPDALYLLPVHLGHILEARIPVRYHGFFPQYELGHEDVEAAERALQLHQAVVEGMRGRGDQVLTVHVGLDRKIAVDGRRAVTNLGRLVDHAAARGVAVALENLRCGPTSDPETVVDWARQSGAMITLDVGHAVSCARVAAGELDPLDFVDLFAGRLIEAHVYEREASRHHAPHDMRVLGPIVDALRKTTCTWWTIELDDPGEALATRTLLLDYLGASPSVGGSGG